MLCATSSTLVLARTGSCLSGPQPAPVLAGSCTSGHWSCCRPLPQHREQATCASSSAADQDFNDSNTIVLLSRAWPDFFLAKSCIAPRTSRTCRCSVPVKPDFWTFNNPTSCLNTCSSACIFPVCRRVRFGRSIQGDCSSSCADHDARLAKHLLQVHEGPMAGDDGWCSTPAECGSLYSAEYGPQWAESWPWQSHMPLLLSGQLLAKHWFPSPSCFSFSCQLSQPFSDLNTPNVVVPEIVPLSPVVLHRRAWLGDLPGTYPCCPGAVLPRWCSDHPGTIVCPLAPGGCPLISAAATLHLGHLHLDLVGDNVPILAVCASGLLTGIVNDVNTRRNNSFQASWRFPCSSTGWWPRRRTDFISWRFPLVRGGSQETLWWPTLPSGLVSLCWSLPSYRPDKQSVGTLCWGSSKSYDHTWEWWTRHSRWPVQKLSILPQAFQGSRPWSQNVRIAWAYQSHALPNFGGQALD